MIGIGGNHESEEFGERFEPDLYVCFAISGLQFFN